MGKSKKPHWDESVMHSKDTHKHSHLHEVPNNETLSEEEMYIEDGSLWQEEMEEDEWIEAEMIEQETSQHYFNDAHEALSKLTQKSNKRAMHQPKRPRRAEVWH